MEALTCNATTKAGTPCRGTLNISATSGKCLMHDDERMAERAAMRTAGGNASKVAKMKAKAANPANVPEAPRTLDDAVKFAAWLTHAVVVGELDARTAHESAYSLNCFKAAVEKRDLQKEIASLRSELAEARKHPTRAGA